MKCFWVIVFFMAISCNNSSNNEVNTTDSAATEYRGVENVNGNIPDTISTGAEPMSDYGADTAKKN